jgi:hypothetical protein
MLDRFIQLYMACWCYSESMFWFGVFYVVALNVYKLLKPKAQCVVTLLKMGDKIPETCGV